MDDTILQDYLKITGDFVPKEYTNPEQQGQSIVKCSILTETSLEYSNSTNDEGRHS